MDHLSATFPGFEPGLAEGIRKHASVRHYRAGETIIRTGQYIQSTMLLVKGRIKIYREDPDGSEFFMYYLLPGQACAISMVCATRMEASQIMAKAIEDTEVYMLPLQQMDQWMSEYKSWYEFVVNTYRSRFEELLQVIDQVAFRGMDERLEFYLQKQSESGGSRHLQISHQEIATELNSSREVISRLLKKMEQRGKLLLHRNHIELL